MTIEDLQPLLLAHLARSEPTGSRALPLAVLKDYATGNQFGENGAYWRGRRPRETDGMGVIERVFAQDDQIGPSLTAIVDGVLSKQPEWTLQQPDSEGGGGASTAVDEATAALATWQREARLHQRLRAAKRAEQWGGRASLRIYIPDPTDGEAPAQGSAPDLPTALRSVLVMAVEPKDGGALRDQHDRIVGYYYRFTLPDPDGKPVPHIELHSAEVIAKYRLDNDKLIQVDETPNPLFDPEEPDRARFLMLEMRREGGSAITPGLRDAQDHLNATSTNLRQNGQLFGFPIWVYKNLQPPPDETITREGETESQVGLEIAPGVVMELVGLEIKDDAGNTVGYATPDADRMEPLDPEGALKEVAHWRASLLRGFDRLWTEAALLTVSGTSRQESRQGWDKRLAGEAPTVVEAVRWAIQTALQLGGFLDGSQPPEAEVESRVFVDASPANLELYRTLLDGHERNVLSLETLLQNTPIDGLDATEELARLQAAPTTTNTEGGDSP